MAALVGEFPRLRLTINLVPSLLDQIEDYAAGTATDPALELARRPADDLNDDDKLAMLDLFFSVPYRTLIAPFPRYAALFHKRGGRAADGRYRDALARFRPDDLRDLQVWFHLAWCGRTLRGRREIKDLVLKGNGFTEDEKLSLLSILDAFLGEIVPIHKRLAAEGMAEIATSPYYHPILPLLCDTGSAREAIPDLPLPQMPYQRPADAAWQVREAIDSMERRFGFRPAGMWPSEGSLSETAVKIMGECGVKWAASDEGVLRASLQGHVTAETIHRPWHLESAGEHSPALFFRDQRLSDLIGFTYSTWPAPDAAADFIERLRAIGREAPGSVVSVILDGENAWEHYPENAVAFLRALYGALTQTDDIETVTFSQALASGPPRGHLHRLRAGSWIGSSFSTWIGHPEKNRAWDLLARARQEAEQKLGAELHASPVFRVLAAAEGSDWFWWFGDDHSSDQDAIFDASFRELLRGVYQMLGAPVPDEMDLPIKQTRARAWTLPTGPIEPVIDGSVSDYFEWLMAGQCDAASGQGSMHEATGMLKRVLFGSNGRSLFVRVDPERGDIKSLLADLPGGSLNLHITTPVQATVTFHLEGGVVSHRVGGIAVRHAAGRVLEVEVPLASPGLIQFSVSLSTGSGTLQRLPRDGAIAFPADQAADWSV